MLSELQVGYERRKYQISIWTLALCLTIQRVKRTIDGGGDGGDLTDLRGSIFLSCTLWVRKGPKANTTGVEGVAC